MRISSLVIGCTVIGLAVGIVPAAGFDGKPTPDNAPVAVPGSRALVAVPPANLRSPNATAPAPRAPAAMGPITSPFEAFRSGAKALRAGKTDQAVTSLEYAAQQGVAAAQWKLGRMYADGDGVDKDNLRAFEYFRRIVSEHADETPGTPRGLMVANAFVALGHFYLDGIPESPVQSDARRARDMFWYAASYFADPDAQYQLGRLYRHGKGTTKDTVQAARWFRLAATKGHRHAQAVLGAMLFKGEEVSRQAALGLFWLIVA
jgi:TPR repeat protein